jgi:mannosylglycoprotein endo-beta-mannosidase
VSDGDVTDLQKLPNVSVKLSAKVSATQARVTLENLSSDAPAFFVQVRVVDADDGREVLPAYWDDNDITLLPKEIRELNVKYERQSSPLRVDVKGWNLNMLHRMSQLQPGRWPTRSSLGAGPIRHSPGCQ